MLLDEIGVNVPRVPVLGLVNESLKQIAAGLAVRQRSGSAFAGNSRRQGFAVAAFVEQAGDATCAGVNLRRRNSFSNESAPATNGLGVFMISAPAGRSVIIE